MKRIILSALCLIAAMTASAQQFMRIWQAGDDVRVALQDITYSADGTFLLADGKQYSLASVDSITMVHVITVTYNGDNATVDIGNAPGVTYSVTGADVNIVSTNVSHELETILQGTSTNGSFTYTGPLKCKFTLNGLNLPPRALPLISSVVSVWISSCPMVHRMSWRMLLEDSRRQHSTARVTWR